MFCPASSSKANQFRAETRNVNIAKEAGPPPSCSTPSLRRGGTLKKFERNAPTPYCFKRGALPAQRLPTTREFGSDGDIDLSFYLSFSSSPFILPFSILLVLCGSFAIRANRAVLPLLVMSAAGAGAAAMENNRCDQQQRHRYHC